VAVCLFDPQSRIGGLNHFMLPSVRHAIAGQLDALLAGDFAMPALLDALLQRGARKARLQAKAFGGGTIIDATEPSTSIGRRNANFTRAWLQRAGIPLLASDFLGPWSRKVLFLPGTGDAFCRRTVTGMASAALIAQAERDYSEALARNAERSEPKIGRG